MFKTGTFQRNLSTTFLKPLNIYSFSKIFQKFKIVKLRWNILQYLAKMLRQYFSCNERLVIFLTCFCNILCYVGLILVINNNCFMLHFFSAMITFKGSTVWTHSPDENNDQTWIIQKTLYDVICGYDLTFNVMFQKWKYDAGRLFAL